MSTIGTQMLMTRGIQSEMASSPDFTEFVISSLDRFHQGDWGEMDAEDKGRNDAAVKAWEANDEDCFERLFASYEFNGGVKIWIITEWDRSATTILFPSEY